MDATPYNCDGNSGTAFSTSCSDFLQNSSPLIQDCITPVIHDDVAITPVIHDGVAITPPLIHDDVAIMPPLICT